MRIYLEIQLESNYLFPEMDFMDEINILKDYHIEYEILNHSKNNNDDYWEIILNGKKDDLIEYLIDYDHIEWGIDEDLIQEELNDMRIDKFPLNILWMILYPIKKIIGKIIR